MENIRGYINFMGYFYMKKGKKIVLVIRQHTKVDSGGGEGKQRQKMCVWGGGVEIEIDR